MKRGKSEIKEGQGAMRREQDPMNGIIVLEHFGIWPIWPIFGSK